MGNITVVTAATPTADDNTIIGWLQAAGHTVTQTSTTTGHTAADVVLYTESGSGSASGGSLSNTNGVMSTEYTVVSLNMSTAAGTSGPSHDTWDLVGTHEVNTGFNDPLVGLSTAGVTWSQTTSQLASGVVVTAVVSTDSTRVVACVAETGATLTSGTAAGRRAQMPLTTGQASRINAAGRDYFLALVNWVGNFSAGPNEGSATGSWSVSGTANGVAQIPIPTGLTATPVSDTEIALDWADAAGASGYDIERNGVVIVYGHAVSNYNDTGLTANTLYTYRVRTVD